MFVVRTFFMLALLPAVSFADFPSFAAYQKILSSHLTENQSGNDYETYFDYKTAKKNSETAKAIQKQLKVLDDFQPSSLKTKEEATAFWINTYNFFMIAKILKDGFKKDRLKIKGVKDLGSFFSPYKAFKEKDFKVGGKEISLDGVEKGILLGEVYKKKGWKDARIHFAVNCASVGCPPLRQKIYTPSTVSSMLIENSKKSFMTHRHLHFKGSTLHLTHLFKWYKKDFEDESGSVQRFIAKFIDDENLKNKILSAKKIKHIEYDWSLNHKENF